MYHFWFWSSGCGPLMCVFFFPLPAVFIYFPSQESAVLYMTAWKQSRYELLWCATCGGETYVAFKKRRISQGWERRWSRAWADLWEPENSALVSLNPEQIWWDTTLSMCNLGSPLRIAGSCSDESWCFSQLSVNTCSWSVYILWRYVTLLTCDMSVHIFRLSSQHLSRCSHHHTAGSFCAAMSWSPTIVN